MKLLIVFSALCLVTVASEQEAVEINENTIPKFLEKCPENIYAISYENNIVYTTVCSLKDSIGYLPPCGGAQSSPCAYESPNSETDVAFYDLEIKERDHWIRQTREDFRKMEPEAIIEKSCEKGITQFPKFCTLKSV